MTSKRREEKKKISRERFEAIFNKPKAPSIIPNKIVAGRMYSHPKTGVEKFTNRLIIGIQIIKKT